MEQVRPRVTIRDIARATGLHHTTISLALRNSPRLPAETRAKIQKMAKKLGYSPDPMLSALNVYRQAKRPAHYQATLAWINNWPQQETLLGIKTFRRYYEGACDRAAQLGYIVEEFWLQQPGMTNKSLLGILKARNIQGLLLAPQPFATSDFTLDCSNLSIVAFGYSLQPPVFHVVANHHFHTMNLMLHHLMELGYQRLGLYSPGDWADKVENAWMLGLMQAWWKHPKLAQIPPCIGAHTLVPKWLQKHKPDVVISYDVIENTLKDLGYDIPKDIGFASLDPDETNPRISGTNENDFYTGQVAVDTLVGLLHRGERGIPKIPIRLLIESTWNAGETVRPQKNAR
jgi:LacI family transcriptional regulator